MTDAGCRWRGFTLIELLVVMAIIATLLSIAAPRYISSVDKAKEAVLRTNLRMLREAIDKHRADSGRYPEHLQQLVEGRYLLSVPVDPITDRSDTWIVVPHPNPSIKGIYDVHSGAVGVAHDGTAYRVW